MSWDETGIATVSSCRPQKKKAKTRKEQSTNKQSKMLSPFPPNVKKDDEVIYREVLTILFSATNLFC
jgi:DNA replication protein DnaD